MNSVNTAPKSGAMNAANIPARIAAFVLSPAVAKLNRHVVLGSALQRTIQRELPVSTRIAESSRAPITSGTAISTGRRRIANGEWRFLRATILRAKNAGRAAEDFKHITSSHIKNTRNCATILPMARHFASHATSSRKATGGQNTGTAVSVKNEIAAKRLSQEVLQFGEASR